MVVHRVPHVGWVAVGVGPVGRVPPVGAVVVLVCVLDVLGWVVVVVVVVGGRVLLHVAVLGVVGVHLGGRARRGRGRGRVGLGRGLPSLTPE